jgi:hypothetical protein
MHNVLYLDCMYNLGLSTHNNGLKRRKQKYPAHFAQHDGNWFITAEYAQFLKECQAVTTQSVQLKGGSHDERNN